MSAKEVLSPPQFRCWTIRLPVPRKREKTLADSFIFWEKAPAFAVNPRGQLFHRVREVAGVLWHGELNHYHVSYLCSNGFNIDPQLITDVLVADPPKDRLLCSHCESRAKFKRMPSADDLAGRHVHVGVLVVRQTCCREQSK